MKHTVNDFEQYIQKDQDEYCAEQMWDKKSERFYEQTEKKRQQFANELVFQLIKERKLLDAASKVLDIGCGTGRHLLEFSAYTSHLTGIDISSKMLAYAQKKLQRVPHATLIHGKWMETFTAENEFDLVFACMTPAIGSIENIQRMNAISKKYCMLERVVYEKDSVQKEIEQRLGRKIFRLPHNDKNYVYGVWNIVWQLGYYPNVFFDKHTQPVTHDTEYYMHGVEYTDEEKTAIMQLLDTKQKDGVIPATESVIKAIVLWDTAEQIGANTTSNKTVTHQ